jgi:hypothetical protein
MYQELVFEMSVALAMSSWYLTHSSCVCLVGSISVKPRALRYPMQPVIQSTWCCRQVVMLHSAAAGASGAPVVKRLG